MAAETETETDTKSPETLPSSTATDVDIDVIAAEVDVVPPTTKRDVAVPDEVTKNLTEETTNVTTTDAADEPTKPDTIDAPPPAVEKSVDLKDDSTEAVDPQKKALEELKQLVVAAIANNEFAPPPSNSEALPEPTAEPSETTTPPPVPAASEDPPKPDTADDPSPEDKPVVVDDDGTKTVEAIAETVVSVSVEPPTPTITTAVAEEVVKEQHSEPPAIAASEEVLIWGVPLVGDDRSDTVLFKFLQAREFKVKEAFDMIKDCVIWRKQFNIEGLLDEDLGFPEMNKVVFMHGIDREGHPVCYNIYGDFQNEEFYEKAFGDAEKRQRFIKWRIQYLEKGIRELLDFRPGGISSMVQVTDFRNAPQFGKHRSVAKQTVALLQDNYPEFIAKKVFINVPWWNLAVFRMMSPFLTQRTKSKFVFAGPSKSAETLFKYIAPEQVPVAYGGLNKEKDPEFTTSDAVTLVTVKPASKQSIEIPAVEKSLVVWELRVIDWDVSYGAEFVPSAEGGYTLIVQKSRKFAETDEPVINNSFKFSEPGKLVLNVENQTSKKKLLLYRFKVKSSD